MNGRTNKNIVEIAVENSSFDTLETAIKTAGLTQVLSSQGPFTVFAPTDEAFAKLPAGTIDNLLQDPQKLGQILRYHVVRGRLDAKTLSRMSSVTALTGDKLNIKQTADGGLMVENARVIQANVDASNGLIHAIDMVLIPS